MKTKGVVNDVTGAIVNSNEDPERALGSARPWLDPSVPMQVCEVIFLFLFMLFTLSVVTFLFNGLYCRIISALIEMHLMILFLKRALAGPMEEMNIFLKLQVIWAQLLEELAVGSLS